MIKIRIETGLKEAKGFSRTETIGVGKRMRTYDLSDGAEVNNKNINLKTITHITKQDPINFILNDDKDPPVTSALAEFTCY